MSLLRISTIRTDLQKPFTDRVNAIANELVVNPNWLMQVMWAESRLNAAAVNPKTKATGLIQFMPDTARGLKTSVEALKVMNPVDQLEYVRRYFLPYKGKMKSYYDVYSVVFFPALIGKPDTWVLQTNKLSAAVIAKQNPVVNINKDAQITVKEFKQYVFNSVLAAHRDIVFGAMKAAAPAAGGIAAAILLFFCSIAINSLI